MSDVSSGVRVWIRLYEADTYFERFMWGKFNASSMKLEPFPGQPLVAPVLSGYGLDGIRNLDPSVRWPIYDYVAYFDAMIQELESQGWIHGISLFGVPWDWRQSMCWTPTLDRLEDALRAARERNNGRKVALVSHSMGALVVKCFMARRPEFFQEAVETWISIAAPHQGASAKIFMEFLQGYNLGNIVIGAEAAKVLSLEAPAVYELLPQENFEWQEQPYIALQWKNGTRQVYGETGGTTGYDIPIRNSLVDHKMTLPWSGETLPEPFNEDCWELSQGTRREIFEVEHPPNLRFYNIYGTNQATPNGLEFTDVGDWRDLSNLKYSTTLTDGDGTVSVESASNHGLNASKTLGVNADHMSILMKSDTLDFVLQALYGRI
ncbi:hypothetical protein GUITHDRAFT_120982 [Guillardia theta CCMP2712]|uniref:Lecithin:cholesterol acyltransferase n=1 Tax=Guillardia theta (strain CCMP2712) TaxID=905079 RepID=L1I9S9_GUITC|nr:hypothetical protein GUITHDRAFT_120982 [Guillardia theta CCMP2712]EKX32832.1 hypothetical protein GUITHDRAFT_120982 [Guillardia theta CCMP2712]|eukprot:XP_005819812.1 hypothetical protein GUITHDRAFT_120982 [Guillardia theta CCMP2712]